MPECVTKKGKLYERIEMEEKVREIIENKIRPLLQRDGGDVELVSVDNGTVKVRLQGACSGCPGAQMTLKMGIERLLREDIPDLKEVIAV